jgi:hypothetical protein
MRVTDERPGAFHSTCVTSRGELLIGSREQLAATLADLSILAAIEARSAVTAR